MSVDCSKTVDKVFTIAKGLNTPNGIAFVDGELYVAEIHRIVKFADLEAHLEKPATPKMGMNLGFPFSSGGM